MFPEHCSDNFTEYILTCIQYTYIEKNYYFINLYFPKSFMRMNLGKRQPDKTDKKTPN